MGGGGRLVVSLPKIDRPPSRCMGDTNSTQQQVCTLYLPCLQTVRNEESPTLNHAVHATNVAGGVLNATKRVQFVGDVRAKDMVAGIPDPREWRDNTPSHWVCMQHQRRIALDHQLEPIRTTIRKDRCTKTLHFPDFRLTTKPTCCAR